MADNDQGPPLPSMAELLHFMTHTDDDIPCEENCSICAEGLVTNPGDEFRSVARMPCGHFFHIECIRSLLDSSCRSRNQCPNCRAVLCRLNLLDPQKLAQSRADEVAYNTNLNDFNMELYARLMVITDDHFRMQYEQVLPLGEEDWIRIIHDVRSSWSRQGLRNARISHRHVILGWTWLEMEVARRVDNQLDHFDLVATDRGVLFMAYTDALAGLYNDQMAAALRAHAPDNDEDEVQDINGGVALAIEGPFNQPAVNIRGNQLAVRGPQSQTQPAQGQSAIEDDDDEHTDDDFESLDDDDEFDIFEDADSPSETVPASDIMDFEDEEDGNKENEAHEAEEPTGTVSSANNTGASQPLGERGLSANSNDSSGAATRLGDAVLSPPAHSSSGRRHTHAQTNSAYRDRSTSTIGLRGRARSASPKPEPEQDPDNLDVSSTLSDSDGTQYAITGSRRPLLDLRNRVQETPRQRELRHYRQAHFARERRRLEEEYDIVAEIQNVGHITRRGGMDWDVWNQQGAAIIGLVRNAIGYTFLGDSAVFYRMKD
jgi:hypothetical protein